MQNLLCRISTEKIWKQNILIGNILRHSVAILRQFLQCDLFLFILFHLRNLSMYFTICVIMKVYEFFSSFLLFSHSFLLFTTTETRARAFQCIGILQAGSTMAHAHTDNSGWVVISVPSIQPKHTMRFNVLERYIRHGIYISFSIRNENPHS